ncbi:MAG: hypothetical protein IJT54_06420 [Candidatus Methanomethylophilaceae archaeon]|nr:hypothetical protein [Candidatus Methanomethylophilaceae archaeon]
MKVLVITVAGSSTRFSKSIGKDCLKCIYTEGGVEDTLLYRLLSMNDGYDRFIIVGGHRYDDLVKSIDQSFGDFRDRTTMVLNDRYADYGSGYSLLLGLQEAMKCNPDEITFAEGDLALAKKDLDKVFESKKDVITYNLRTIRSDESVVFYFDSDDRPKYVYDTDHKLLKIDEPFRSIYNSGQVWKFRDMARLKSIIDGIDEDGKKDTNLIFINRYFSALAHDDMDLIPLTKWVNCNTVNDYRRSIGDDDE